MPAYRLPVRADCLRWTRAPTLARFRFHHMGQPPRADEFPTEASDQLFRRLEVDRDMVYCP